MTAPFVSYKWIEVSSKTPGPVDRDGTPGRRLHEHDGGRSS
jgi:hypothetical protein